MSRSGQWSAPLSGLAFVVLLLLSFVVGGEPPASDGATEEIGAFWSDNETENIGAAFLGALAAVAAVWFGAHVRSALRRAEGDGEVMSLLAFAGFLTVGIGNAAWSGFRYVAADTAGDVPPEVTQILAVLVEWYFLPFATGMVLAFLASAVAILRHGGLPRWLGYLALPIPVFFFTPVWFVGLIGAAIFIVGVSVALGRGTPAGSQAISKA
jgi:hypothetical protein